MISVERIPEPPVQTFMKLIVLFFIISPIIALSQNGESALVIGNVERLCLPDTTLIIKNELPDSLENFNTIFLFSNATSLLSTDDVVRIDSFIVQGGGLYNGADNWPLQAEANQISQKLYRKESFGNYEEDLAVSNEKGNLALSELDSIPAGTSTSAFPMDYRLRVEAWVADQPLILSGEHGKGHIVIDTGYSRFYCDLRDENTDIIFEKVFRYLRGETAHR